MSSAMSFMNTKNNRGPRTDPWGTPAFKSSRYGIKGDLLMWLKSYLTNRSQKVAIKEALSELDDLKAGVPQGSKHYI
jgi:hypothetical protein